MFAPKMEKPMHWEKMKVTGKPLPTPTAVMMRAMSVLMAAFAAIETRRRRKVK
jgi:hypothetical protein